MTYRLDWHTWRNLSVAVHLIEFVTHHLRCLTRNKLVINILVAVLVMYVYPPLVLSARHVYGFSICIFYRIILEQGRSLGS